MTTTSAPSAPGDKPRDVSGLIVGAFVALAVGLSSARSAAMRPGKALAVT